MKWIAFVLGVCISLGAAREANAQYAARSAPATTIISIDPLLVLAGGLSAEFETYLAPEFGLSFTGTYVPGASTLLDRDEHYGAFTTEARYYPQGRALSGIAFGVGAGYVDDQGECCKEHRGPSIGFSVSYNWLLGMNKHFAVGTGIGAKRVFASGNNNSSEVLPTARLKVGFAF